MRKLFCLLICLGMLTMVSTAIATDTWETGEFTDEFGDPTGKKYVQMVDPDGRFSNSATSNASCPAMIRVTSKGHVGIFLFEYDRRPPAYFIRGDEAKLKMKTSTGKLYSTTGMYKWNQAGGMALRNPSGFIKFLKNNPDEIKVVVFDEHSSQYHFKITGSGFKEAYNEIRILPKPDASIKKIQIILKELKFYTGSIDGLYGKGTAGAIKSLQNSIKAEIPEEMPSYCRDKFPYETITQNGLGMVSNCAEAYKKVKGN